MDEDLLALVSRQRVLNKRTNQVRVWMISELERLVHRVSAVPGAASLCE